jgi:hypothetical protein
LSSDSCFVRGPDERLATLYTDQNGWYMCSYEHTGKAATFMIRLPDYGRQQPVILKSNSFVVANFQTWCSIPL